MRPYIRGGLVKILNQNNMNAIDPCNRRVTCDVNGKQNVDLTQISCPICKETMEICGVEETRDDYHGHLDFEPSPICHGVLDRVYNASGIRSCAIDLKCPNCGAILKVQYTTNIRERQICY